VLEVIFAIFGLVFGSFATVVAYRVPRKETIASGRSRCPNCGRQIRAIENVPVFSYVFLRGRCPGCGERISPRYPLIEIGTAVLFVVAAAKFGLSGEAFVFAALFWVLVVLTVIDLEHKLLPNRIVYPATTVGASALVVLSAIDGEFGRSSGTVWLGAAVVALLLAILLWPAPETAPGDVAADETPTEIPLASASETSSGADDDTHEKTGELPPIRWYEVLILIVLVISWIALIVVSIQTGPYNRVAGAVIGVGVFSGLFFFLSLVYPAGMGGGDVKLTLLLGAMLGYLKAPAIVLTGMFLSFAAGGVVSIGLLLARRAGRKTGIAFGPFLALGTVLAVVWGENLADYYSETL
jgi:prepilin signal peptidase PulO-like enzyme (type II secretory pathway)